MISNSILGVVGICLKPLCECERCELLGTAVIFTSLTSGCGKALN